LPTKMSALIKTFYTRQWQQINGTSRIARPIDLPSGWARIRVGALCALSGAASETLNMGFGFCSGTTNILGDATTTHWIGYRSTGAWSYNGGGGAYTSGTIQAAKLVGTTFTTGAGASGYDISDIAARDHVAGWFVDIIKGAPNYGLEIVFFDTAPGANSMSEATFDSLMAIGNNLNSAKPVGYYYQAATVACDEATDGYFDAVCFSWPGSSTDFLIDKMSVSAFAL